MNTLCLMLLLCFGPLLSASLSCLPCDLSKCTAPSDCSSGTVLDACGCCQVCAKVNGAGERCGDIAGSCDSKLVCVKDEQNGGLGTCQARDNTCRNGTDVFQQGHVWRSGCSTCTCLERDHIFCALPECPILDCNETTFAADGCCAVCRSDDVIISTATVRISASACTSSSGHVYQDGASWSEETCTKCFCNSGNIQCSQQSPVCTDVTTGAENNTELNLAKYTSVDSNSTSLTPRNNTGKVQAIANSIHDSKTQGDVSDEVTAYSARLVLYLLPIGLGLICLVVGTIATTLFIRRSIRHSKLVQHIVVLQPPC